MQDSPENRLPDSFAETGDPVEGNPFPEKDARHRVWHWQEATKRAEEEVCRIKADASLSLTPDTTREWFPNLIVAQFDVWARRGIHVVWSDAELQQYDRWLVSYANAWLDMMTQFYVSHPPPVAGFAEDVLTETRNRLGRRVHFWKGEARRYRAEQEAHIRAAPTEDAPTNVDADVIERRDHLISRYRHEHNLTAVAFARRVGASETAIRGMVREDRHRFSEEKRNKLLKVLGVSESQWYGR